jgi:hypothetical protein
VKTLDQCLREQCERLFGNTDVPFSFGSAFMMGAAAMAELFASGQALKLDQTPQPRRYVVKFREEAHLSDIEVRAYTDFEAMELAARRADARYGSRAFPRPAIFRDLIAEVAPPADARGDT